jgi:hypothetical protein
VVDSSTITWSRRTTSDSARAAASSGPRSGDRARREPAGAEHRAEAVVRDVLDRRGSARKGGDTRVVDVDADDVLANLRERDRQRQADVAKSDDSDAQP